MAQKETGKELWQEVTYQARQNIADIQSCLARFTAGIGDMPMYHHDAPEVEPG